MSFVGKTVARIEEQPVGECGYRDSGTVLIHFTDGTALKIEGASYEEVSQSLEDLSAADALAYARRAQGLREQERLARLQRQEWLSISCEERGERRRAREAKMDPFASVMKDTYAGALADMLMGQSRMLYGGRPERRVRMPCENCGERECPSAPVKVYPAEPAPGFNWSTASFKVEPGTLK